MEPPGPTMLDALSDSAIRVSAVGKISDIFSGRGISDSVYSSSDGNGVDLVIERVKSGQAVTRANLDLAPSDIDGVGQEDVRSGEVDFHCWF